MYAPVLIERDHNSLTIGWPSISSIKCYEVQMCCSSSSSSVDEDVWQVLSSTVKNHILRKKHLQDGIGYRFRYRVLSNEDVWSSISDPSEIMTVLASDFNLMKSPTLAASDGSSITVNWEPVPDAEGYAIRFRKDDSIEWKKIETVIKGTVVRKKGLESNCNYLFSVLPIGESLVNWSYSPSTLPLHVAAVAAFYQNLLPSTLLHHANGKTCSFPLTEAVAGKVIGFYFSAHWCPPCRNFTPKLIELYNQCRKEGKSFEVIFCSADHSEEEFSSYYSSMPWAAVEYGNEKREEIMHQFHVSGIPRLCIYSPSGKLIDDNAVEKPLSIQLVNSWLTHT